MALDDLDTPLRMTWCLDGRLAPARQLHLADRLVEAGLFELTLSGDPFACPALDDILSRLAARGMQVTLVLRAEAACHLSAELPLTRVVLDLSPPPGSISPPWRETAAALAKVTAAGLQAGLQLLPLRSTLELVPELFRFARDQEVADVSLPNVPVADRPDVEWPSLLVRAADLASFSATWKRLDPPAPVPARLVVHDLFLWDILCPGTPRNHYSGCQAGTSLAHLDANGNLYPCVSWNEPMGSLFDVALADYWQREMRRAVRAEIGRTPRGCDGCSAYAACFGGCRGLSRDYAAEEEGQGGRDLMCPDRR